MSWSEETIATIKRLSRLQQELKADFTQRDEAVSLLTLALVCQEHLLLVGPPGTAKTELTARFAEHLELASFHYLLTRFTEPAEIFGPMDVAAFKKGVYTVRTEGMLPEARLVFLDEIFQGSSAILNTLLTIVHERVFHNGAVHQKVPLLSLVGASNLLPDEPGLRAFADRFVLRAKLDPVADDALGELLDQGWQLERRRMEAAGGAKAMPWANEEQLRALQRNLTEVKLGQIRDTYQQVIRELRAQGVELSDRRVVKGLKLLAGAALLRQGEQAEAQDLWPLCNMWSRPEDAEVIEQVVRPRVVEAGGPSPVRSRSAAEIDEELDELIHAESGLGTETAVAAHLQSLGRQRREILRHHGDNVALRKKAEDAVERVMAKMGQAHV